MRVLEKNNMVDDDKKRDFKNMFFDYFIIAIPIFAIILFDTIFGILTSAFYSYTIIIPNNYLLFKIYIALVLFGIFFAIFKNTYKATKILYFGLGIFYILNQIKILYAGEPITCYDINFIGKLGDLINLIKGTQIIKLFVIIIAFCFCLVIVILPLKVCKKRAFELNSFKVRIPILVFCVANIYLLLFQTANIKDFCLKNFYHTDQIKDNNSYTDNLSYYMKYGVVSGNIGVYLNSKFSEPDGYNDIELNKQLYSIKENDEKKLGKPNIIVIFSEAFWDLNKISDIEFDKSPTYNLEQLKNEGKLCEVITPSFGGMSENVAFELFTGGSMKYFQNGYIPMVSLKNTNKNISSLVKELKNNNYYSKIVFGKDYYNVEESCYYMGFDEYKDYNKILDIYGKDSEFKSGFFLSDEYLIDKLIEDLETKNSEKNYFYVLETIENHMPYNKYKYKKDEFNLKINNTTLPEEETSALLAYANGTYNAVKSLNKLYEYIKNIDEPTMILFLGDHLPSIQKSNGDLILEQLNYFNSDNEILNNYRYYNTECLMLSNYNADFSNIPDYLGTDLLITSICNNMNIELSQYYKWLYQTKDILPASNKLVSLDKEGKIYSTNNLNGSMQKIATLKEYMQYKFFIK